jgi:hypothetical protein
LIGWSRYELGFANEVPQPIVEPVGRYSLAQHGAADRGPRFAPPLRELGWAGGVLGKADNRPESRRCLCHSSSRNEAVGSIAPDERENQPRSGEMVLGGGVSPRSSGKKNEPQSDDTSYDTDTVATAQAFRTDSRMPLTKSTLPSTPLAIAVASDR